MKIVTYSLTFTLFFFSVINFAQQANSVITKFPAFEDCTLDDQELENCFENELKNKIIANYKSLEIAYDEAYSEEVRFNVEITRKGEFVVLATDSFNSRTFIAASRAIGSLPKIQPALGKNERPVVFNFTLIFSINRDQPNLKNAVDVNLTIGYELFDNVKNTPF